AAALWFALAAPASAGFAEGAAAYARGDYATALREFLPLARQGHSGAQNNLGVMYETGQGVPQDYAEAVKWYRRAADQGFAKAQFSLGAMYDTGQGVSQDYVLAHLYLNLAGARLPPGEARDYAVRNRDRFAKLMTPAQLARAQEMARNWQPRTETAAAPSPSYTAPQQRSPSMPSGETVRTAQLLLSVLGYDPGPADGVIGSKTRTAIRAFQSRVGLPVDDQVSEALVARLTEALAVARAAPPQPAQRKRELHSTGTGFAVGKAGHVVTNHHVIEECGEVRARQSMGESGPAAVVARDRQNDLALLKMPRAPGASASFREGRGVRQGDAVVAFGFPLHGLLASEPSLTTGTLSALSGIGDDTRFYQITAPVQPGNSGGALLDGAGNVIGVVVGKLDAIRVARATGDIPQNVNFAIKASLARSFLDANGIDYDTQSSGTELKPAEVGERARKFTVLVECWT
ncbi:MAG: trypsin-like peptidase domain-containing protein, partial [Pseudomonadota bacterium]